MKNGSKIRKRYRSFLSADYLQPYLDSFAEELFKKGYTALTINGYYDSVAHFSMWLQKKCISFENINDTVLSRFAKHRCYCPGARRTHSVSSKYVGRIRRFIAYLSRNAYISIQANSSSKPPSPFVEKFKKSLQCRGLSIRTIITYEYSIYTLLPLLGNVPQKYNAVHIRQAICNLAKKKSRCEVKKLTTALRAYLRLLTTEGVCCPDLDVAVPTVAEWKLSSLPKYITEQEMERTIAACDIHTQQGIRDRAIILLLSRLGLRAGDVSNMRIDDIDWLAGTLRVCGKGRRETRLPLPQEVGDALLVYLEKGRPPVALNPLFLCLNAPYRAFPNSSGISSVVSAALTRAGIQDPPSRGASLLRHSVATAMLRKGATLETVSSVLRHQSLDMTCYYAKVDIPRLMKIAQAWPEGAPC